MRVASGQVVTVGFRVKNAAGALVDATGTPTAVLYLNGVSTAVVVTVTSVTGAGKYKASWTNGTYSSGDQLRLEVTATVGGTSYSSLVWEATVDEVAATAANVTDAQTAIIARGDAAWVTATGFSTHNAAAAAAAVRTELATELGRIDTNIASRLAGTAVPANFAALGINASGHISRVTLVDTTTANSDMRGTDGALLAGSAPANFGALGISASGHVSRVVLVDTTTTNTDMRGTDGAALAANWTAARAGYLDNLNVGGSVASQADVQAVTQASRVRLAVPPQMERPTSGSRTYRLWIYNYDELHQANDLDALPVVTAEDHSGVDLSTGLGAVTKPAGTGIYYVDFTVAAADTAAGVIFKVTATEETIATQYVATSTVVDATAVDFTAADRSKLEAVYTKLPTAAYLLGGTLADGLGYSTHSAAGAATAVRTELAAELANMDATISSRSSHTAADAATATAPAVRTELATELGRIDVTLSSRGTFTATVGAAAGFEHFFDVLTPASTMNDVTAGGAGANPVHATVLDNVGVPVQSAKVNIQSSTGGTLGIYAYTDSSGVARFSLDDGDYQAAISSMSGFNAHTPQAFTVSAATLVGGKVSVALTFERTAPVVAADPALCVVKCYITDAGGQAVEGISISATPKSRSLTVPSKIVTLIAATAETDATGYAELRLPRADAIDSGGSKAYRFQIRNNGTGVYDLIEKEIPNTGETTLDVIVNS